MSHIISHKSLALQGTIKVPGDKSISHRAIIFASLAVGESKISGLLEGEDVIRTVAAMRAVGAHIEKGKDGVWSIYGVGVGGLTSPDNSIDLGNSGTGARLLLGLFASHNIRVVLTGDASLGKRPMGRVVKPLMALGAEFDCAEGFRLPIVVRGAIEPVPIEYCVPVPSAQVKSSLLLAGLNTAGTTVITEKTATRDHSERMLQAMGADLTIKKLEDDRETGVDERTRGRSICLKGEAELSPINISVPGDISSAAFILVAATIVPGSDVTIEKVGLNPLRTGIIDALVSMGADITLSNERNVSGEPVGDIRVRAKELKGVTGLPVHPSTMIDEFPALFVAAASAEGDSRFQGLGELRVKESDRLSAMADALSACGTKTELLEDGIVISGGGIKGGGLIKTHLDHRIAMAGLLMGLVSLQPVALDDGSPIGTSFPGFIDLLNGLGAQISQPEDGVQTKDTAQSKGIVS